MNYVQQIEVYFGDIMDALYPIRKGRNPKGIHTTSELAQALTEILKNNVEEVHHIDQVVADFMAQLQRIKAEMDKDIICLYKGDPAAKSHNEVILAYPGFYAIAAYRIANHLLHAGVPLVPRIISEHAHNKTGVDIHPSATIGDGLCIDHGTGVVIGETTVIGNNVKIYQGVTLGALSIPDKKVTGKRHPTIEDNVVIYAQATILGGDTIIGKNSIIGGNVWITNSIQPNSKVYYNPGNNVRKIIKSNISHKHGD